ncbi:MAG: hypothetical protein A2X25_02720 [Chloroflexi bacterium GWB2_49_20]|nr:MAG: hypothetical protein A2X25_02720 [Chloroflexi bacterium GWB2_49_20]OGN78780.1 MAG: hypothetical protein A2X26_13060 [Chloroflexi bacterium GWC2_49_37]OGN85850.1 MAG: hypothetical protein A2X27_11625 [Chloroflexi bacterium GWD2_49_16]
MAKAEIFAGNCGFNTTVETRMNGKVCNIHISSECAAIQRMAEELTQVNPFQEISFKRSLPLTHEMGVKYCTHAACPVTSGIIKAVEVEAGLALPTDVTIRLSKTNKE